MRWNQFAEGKNLSHSMFIKIIQECLWMMMMFIICIHLFAFILLLNALRFIVFVNSRVNIVVGLLCLMGTFETVFTRTNFSVKKSLQVESCFLFDLYRFMELILRIKVKNFIGIKNVSIRGKTTWRKIFREH